MRNLTCLELENVHGGERNRSVMVRQAIGSALGVVTAASVFGVELLQGESLVSSAFTALAASYIPVAMVAGYTEFQVLNNSPFL